MATTWIVIPEEFRSNESGHCAECHTVTNGECGHFLDARDIYGPYKTMNWQIGLDKQPYYDWIAAHHSEIRYVQEHPNYADIFPAAPEEQSRINK